MSTSTKSLGFPAHFYTDANHFDHEMQTIWRDTWQLVGRANVLAEPGDYLTCTLGKEPIFVVRTTDGSLQASHNLCPHRGARILAGEGNCPTHKITCPYHGWTFDLAGNLLGVANAKLFPIWTKRNAN